MLILFKQEGYKGLQEQVILAVLFLNRGLQKLKW
jgi:hypothetical protein